ncbi:MAG: SRPBCC family protein [Verrucomicrobiaceae bacterium]|jgi:ligand-binding SRPBCC domain-containing protein|nr:SRPBCC family protein [Verrucomicrobiaceae bacterium]
MSCTFHASTKLAASTEVMFAFHSDPRNIVHVMPPTLKVTSLETGGLAQEGRLIELHGHDWGIIPLRWKCRWRTVQPPHVLVDEMLEGPFEQFVHEHRFEPLPDGGCVMHDTITFAFGRSWWGRMLSGTVVRLYLAMLFKYRHFRTRQWAAQHEQSEEPVR